MHASAASTSSCRPRTRRAAHLLGYGLLGLALVCVVVARCVWPMVLNEAIRVEPARVGEVEQRIDPNTAGWEELARLPDIGEVLARRIVAYREEQRSAWDGSGKPVAAFSCVADLDSVQGIGPKTLARIGPYLRFLRREVPAAR